jgi:uncharacterized protein
MDLLFNLSRLRDGVSRLDRRFEPDAFAAGDDFRIVAPVVLTAEVRKDGPKIGIAGRLQTRLECACSRCLDPVGFDVDAPFDLRFLPAAEHDASDEHEIPDEDLGVSFYRGDQIDLGDLVTEQSYLLLPMKPLCREDCRGLCPVCGINRNRETCACDPRWKDPRMAALERFTSS